jgi:Phosphotransferase enzyme family
VAALDTVSDGEREIVGLTEREAIDGWLDRTLQRLLGVPLAEVMFIAGRIDVVYGVRGGNARRLLVKVHRLPVDLAARRLVAEAQQVMAVAGFPCAEPLAGPVEIDGRVVSIETLLPEGERGDGHDPQTRTTMAADLARHIQILAAVPGFAERIGEPPAWCLYQRGAWSASHMTFFDFRTTPPEYAWLQRFAQGAAERTVALREQRNLVVAHADWYGGNLRFEGHRLVAAFDWDLLADTEPIVVGITAGMFSAGTAMTATPPAPEETAAFMADYEAVVGRRFSSSERDLATAAACWSLAYTARCDVTILDGADPRPGSALDLLRGRRKDYLNLDW